MKYPRQNCSSTRVALNVDAYKMNDCTENGHLPYLTSAEPLPTPLRSFAGAMRHHESGTFGARARVRAAGDLFACRLEICENNPSNERIPPPKAVCRDLLIGFKSMPYVMLYNHFAH